VTSKGKDLLNVTESTTSKCNLSFRRPLLTSFAQVLQWLGAGRYSGFGYIVQS
jgi:hypothetical protein